MSRLGEIHQPDRAAADLVLVGRADAALGGADLDAAARPPSRMRVEFAVQRQDQRRVLGDLEVVGRHLDALRRAAARFRRPDASGSTTTPLPITDSLPGRTTPEGSSASL